MTSLSRKGHSLPAGRRLFKRWICRCLPVRQPSCVSEKHVGGSHREAGDFRVFDKRYWPGDQCTDHLTFALRHEPVDLLILKQVFDALPKAALEAFIRSTPMGTRTRRAWFFYEVLIG